MPLSPSVTAVLNDLAPAGGPARQFSVAERRAAMRDRFTCLGGPRAPLASARDLTLAGVPVRLYRPHGTGAQPALIYLHGGGWALGSIKTHDAVCSHLAHESGWTVLSVGYRLAPEHKFPIPLLDCWAALQTVRAQAEALSVDPSRIAVAGDSAGGNLSAAVALLARDYEIPLAAQVLIYPITDYLPNHPSYEFDYLLARADIEWFWSLYLNHNSEAALPLATPMRAESLRRLPPCLLLTAEYDPLRDEGEEYARQLAAAEVPVTAKCYPGMIHGFVSMPAAVPEARDALSEIAAFLWDADPRTPR